VPPIEEAFYRSFLYRYLVRADYASVPLNQLNWRALVITSLIFGFSHYQWLAAFVRFNLPGISYSQGSFGRCHDRACAYNFLLGVWVASKGAWQFGKGHETNERSAGLRPAAALNEIAASSVSERASQCEAAAGRESRAPFIGRRTASVNCSEESASLRRRLRYRERCVQDFLQGRF
jgi:hypothetical protein